MREPASAASFFAAWARAPAGLLLLELAQCVGYKMPLFLGGKHVLENLEVIDIDVYWSISGQLRQRTKTLPPGSSIRRISGTF